ncbi:MAG: endonuclease domain-containing protein [Alphaproteobacteria bacterium]|nr:endonuclease domain-containing protein [Alphaproteobacteria bacterium]
MEPPRPRPVDTLVGRARDLRRHPTDAERALWRHLRQRQLAGYRFRRQTPVGPFIVDFLCVEAGLVTEIDGGQHATQEAADTNRTAWLESQGLRVLSFWNNEVLANVAGGGRGDTVGA